MGLPLKQKQRRAGFGTALLVWLLMPICGTSRQGA